MRLTSLFHPSHPRGGHPPHSNLVRGKLTSPTPTLQETGPTVLRPIRDKQLRFFGSFISFFISCAHSSLCQVHAFLEPPIEGVVLETYGSGNGPDSRKELLEEIRAAAKRGVIIVNCTQCLYGHVVDSYATGRVCSWF